MELRKLRAATRTPIVAWEALDQETRSRIARLGGAEVAKPPHGGLGQLRLRRVVERAVQAAEQIGEASSWTSRRFGRQQLGRWRPPGPHWSSLARRRAAPLLWSILAHGLLIIVMQLTGVWTPAAEPRLLTLTPAVDAAELEELEPLQPFELQTMEPQFEAVESAEFSLPEVAPNASLAALTTPSEAEPALKAKLGPLGSLSKPTNGLQELLAKVPQSPKGRAKFFGIESESQAVCFLVDSSRSMRGKFDLARMEVLRAVSQLKPNQRFYVLLFDQNVERMRLGEQQPLQPVKASVDNKRLLQQWLAQTQMESSCDPVAALEAALAVKADTLFLLTDGELPPSLLEILRRENRQQIDGQTRIRMSVNTIGLHSLRGQALLARIANENGGSYRFVPKPNRSGRATQRR